jgi:threonyl-tRNA synthetase
MDAAARTDVVRLTLPDGSLRELPRGATGQVLAASIGKRLARDALGVKVTRPGPNAARAAGAGPEPFEVFDLLTPLPDGAAVQIFTAQSAEGLELIRHSAAHVMASAVQRLWPGTQVTIGPTVENGFYYDFFRPQGPFTDEELALIEKTMREIAAADTPFVREEVSRAEARRLFESMGEKFKCEILDGIPEGDTITLYRHADWVDLCRGPHVPRTSRIGAFKLLKVAGAYWRGDEHNPMLSRIYGTAWPDQQQLDAHLAALADAERRDHRRLGKDLGLFYFHPWAPASPFFHPRGAFVYNRLLEYVRALYRQYGYQEVMTPQVYDTALWETSGHLAKFKDAMFFAEIEERQFGLKPMNCPGHCLLFAAEMHSYRELPYRMADFGRLHRFERSGVVAGLTRVRSFSQDDAHIFCTEEQIEAEATGVVRMILACYRAFGFEKVQVNLATRPENSLGGDMVDDADRLWTMATEKLERVLRATGTPYQVKPGEGAFYGPKIDFDVHDALGRAWQLGTCQLDFMQPHRFGLEYAAADGTRKRPVMVHRAMLGSIERFLGVYIEHCAGVFPPWLAPVQALVLPVGERHAAYAEEVAAAARARGARVEVEASSDKLGKRIRAAEMRKVPYMAVAGDNEMGARTVAVRAHGGADQGAIAVDAFVERLVREGALPVGGTGA